MSFHAANPSLSEARAVLGLAPNDGPGDVVRAFRAAAKRAHPDLAGGEGADFCRLMDAYRLLQAAAAAPQSATRAHLRRFADAWA